MHKIKTLCSYQALGSHDGYTEVDFDASLAKQTSLIPARVSLSLSHTLLSGK